MGLSIAVSYIIFRSLSVILKRIPVLQQENIFLEKCDTLQLWHTEIRSVPKQLIPSPVKPGLHAHVKPPGMLLQTAFGSQLWFPKAQSSTSAKGNKDARLSFTKQCQTTYSLQPMSGQSRNGLPLIRFAPIRSRLYSKVGSPIWILSSS